MRMIDLSGKVFERWTVLKRVENTVKGQTQWLCRCECGTERVMQSILLRNNISRSCGCLKHDLTIERNTKHGHRTTSHVTPTYHTWCGMKARCTNPKNSHYPRYGGRGITVCERWNIFPNFLADMGEKPKGTSLERIDNDGNYEPGNCEWATAKRQARNKSNNRLLAFQGETLPIAEWAERLGIRAAIISERIIYGWDVDRALSTPAGTTSDNVRSTKLTHNGQTLTLSEWSRLTGILIPTLCQRIKRGWSIEKALSS